MKTSNQFLQCMYISSAIIIIICGVFVYTWHYNIGSLSSQQLEEDINDYSTLSKYHIYVHISIWLCSAYVIC